MQDVQTSHVKMMVVVFLVLMELALLVHVSLDSQDVSVKYLQVGILLGKMIILLLLNYFLTRRDADEKFR